MFTTKERSGINRKELLEFEELFYMYYPRLKNFALHLLKDDGEAEDLVQDVFIQTWNQYENLSDLNNISPYLFTLLKNKCLNKLKREVVKRKYEYHHAYFDSEELYHISFNDKGEFIPMQELLCIEIEKVIQKMPPKCGEVFRQKWVEGKKHREIAETMHISLTMVDKHLMRGMEIARKHLRPEYLLLLLYYYQ